MQEQDKLDIIKDILFTDDREYAERISKRLNLLEKKIEEKKQLSSLVNPLIDEKLQGYTKSIPSNLGPVITKALEKEINKSKEQVADMLYPIIGKMIKKYIAQEMKLLSEKITSSFKKKPKSWFRRTKNEEFIVNNLSTTAIEQVLLIDKESGILSASYCKTKTIDEEMIAGMMTAIKNFVEDAFDQRNQNLELIEYELYNIHIQSFTKHYVAVVISGNYTLKSKNKVQDVIFDFYEKFTKKNLKSVVNTEEIEKDLRLSFENESI